MHTNGYVEMTRPMLVGYIRSDILNNTRNHDVTHLRLIYRWRMYAESLAFSILDPPGCNSYLVA